MQDAQHTSFFLKIKPGYRRAGCDVCHQLSILTRRVSWGPWHFQEQPPPKKRKGSVRDSSFPSATRPELSLESLVDLMNLCHRGLPGKMSNCEEESCKMPKEGRCFFFFGGGSIFWCGWHGGNFAWWTEVRYLLYFKIIIVVNGPEVFSVSSSWFRLISL